MKIKVKKLLKEYSKEERSFFGDGIQALIDNPDKLYYVKEVDYMGYPEKRQALNRAWIEENIGPRLGGGAFRDAFEIKGHDDKILKISNRSLQDELGDGQESASIAEDTNQYEIDLFNQYPEFFPRVFMSDQEIEGIPRWLIIEKAKVIDNAEDFDNQILIAFPALKRAMNTLNMKMALNGFDDYAEYHNSASPLNFLLAMRGSGDDGYHGTGLDEKLYSYFLSKSVDWESLRVSPRELIDKIMAPVWKIMTTDPKMIKFNDMMKKLRIQPTEIDVGNVGTDIATGKKFLIIDISIFDDLFEETKKPITEGGNVFKGQTDSIPLEFIEPTLEAYYEELGRLFPVYVAEFDTFQPLGSVGKKARSGDIDLAVDVQELFPDGEVNPEDIAQWGLDPEAWKQRVEKLTKRARSATASQIGWKAFLQLLADYINENSDLISADTKLIGPGTMFSLFPQFNEAGEQQEIGVQIDWMVGNIDWLTFSYFSDALNEEEPLLKGLHRTQMIHALMLAKNHSFSHTKGVKSKDTGEIVAFNKEEILSLISELYDSPITSEDTLNFNTLFRWLQNASTTDRSRAIAAYLKILDRTNGNKDLDGSRCGYIPKVLEKIYLSLYENGALRGKFLCKEANPTLWQAVHGSIQEQADNEVGFSGAPEPSQEFLASLQALVEPFINSDIRSASSLNHQLSTNEDSPIIIIGIGSDKIVFSHPDYPEWVFKVVKPNAVKDEAGDEKYVWNTLKDSQFASILAPIIGYDGTPVYAMRKTSSGGSLEDIKDTLYEISSDKYKDFEYYLLADANKSNIGLIGGQSVLTDYDQWDYYFRTYGEKLQEQADEKITVVIPGGFKPPHRGHVEMINHFANLPEVGEVIVFTGSKPRMSDDGSVVVTKDKSIQLFNLFDLAPNVRFGEVAQRPKKDGSTYENPFMDAVGTLFDENFSGKKVAIGHPTKDAGYSDKFEKIVRGSTRGGKSPMVAKLVRVPTADTTGDLSATDLRNAVQSGNREELARFIPEDIAEDYLKILIGD